MNIGVFSLLLLLLLFLFIFIFFFFLKISAFKNIYVTVLSVRSMTSPPHFPSVKCVAVDYDGSVWNNNQKGKDSLKFEDGSTITNYENYFM
jgi:hypothetical protein